MLADVLPLAKTEPAVSAYPHTFQGCTRHKLSLHEKAKGFWLAPIACGHYTADVFPKTTEV